MTNTPAATDDQLIRRALVAYIHSDAQGPVHEAFGGLLLASVRGDAAVPSTGSSVEEHDGHKYVVLRAGDVVIAVYRVQNRGELRRLKRPPQELLS